MDQLNSVAFGTRSRKNILDGKKIRKHKDGGHVYEDYFSNSDDENSSSVHLAVHDSPCKIAAYCSPTKDKKLGTKSISSQLFTIKKKKDLEHIPLSKSATNHSKTSNKASCDVLAEETAILSKANDKLNSPESTGRMSCTSKTLVKVSVNSEVPVDDIMHSNINILSQANISDHKSSDSTSGTETRLRRKTAAVPEIVNPSNAAIKSTIFAEGIAGTETILQPNNDEYAKFCFLKDLSLLPSSTAEFLKQQSKKHVRVTRSYKPVTVNECLDEFDAKIMQIVEADFDADFSHKSFMKECTVQIQQMNSTTGKNPEVHIKNSKSVGLAPKSKKKANSDLIDKSCISKQVVVSDKSKENFELLDDKQNEDNTISIISDKHPLNNNCTNLKAVENESFAHKTNKSVSKVKKSGQKISNKTVYKINKRNEVSSGKLVKNTPSKANKRTATELRENPQDENPIYRKQNKTPNLAHEISAIGVLSESDSSEKNDSAYDNGKLISQTTTAVNKSKSLAYINKKTEKNGINNSKYKRNLKNYQSRAHEINNATDCEIDNLKSSLENTVNKYSPKKRKVIDHEQNTNGDVHSSLRKTTKKQTLAKKDAYSSNKQYQQNELSENCNNVRRSTRTKYQPFASWKNERLLYGFKNGTVQVFGIDHGSEAPDYAAEELKKKKYYENSVSKKKSTKIIKPKKAKIINPVLHRKMKVDLCKKFDLIPWHVPAVDVNSPDWAYRIKKMLATSSNSFGFVEIAVDREKPLQYTPKEDVILTPVRGKVEIVIRENSYTLCTKDTIFVPRGSAYSLKNIGNASALIYFVVGKFMISEF